MMMQDVVTHGMPQPGNPADYASPQLIDNGAPRSLFRTRKPNWTEQETLMLVALVDKHCILRSRLMDYNTNQQKTEVWCTITALINQRNSTVQRTVDEVKRRWQNVYSIAKRETSEYHLAVKNKTPQMSTPQLHQFLCPISVRLVEIFGGIDNFGTQQHNGTSTLFQFDHGRSNSSYDVNSEKSSVESVSLSTPSAASRVGRTASDSAPLILPELPQQQQRAIKREVVCSAQNGDPSLEPAPAWAGSLESSRRAPPFELNHFTIDPCSPESVPDLSAAPPYAKHPRFSAPPTCHSGTQTDTEESEEQKLKLEMLRYERDLLRMQCERAQVRLERDRMRLKKEEAMRDLKLERMRLQTAPSQRPEQEAECGE